MLSCKWFFQLKQLEVIFNSNVSASCFYCQLYVIRKLCKQAFLDILIRKYVLVFPELLVGITITKIGFGFGFGIGFDLQ